MKERANIHLTLLYLPPCQCGSLSPRHGATSGCRWGEGLQIWR